MKVVASPVRPPTVCLVRVLGQRTTPVKRCWVVPQPSRLFGEKLSVSRPSNGFSLDGDQRLRLNGDDVAADVGLAGLRRRDHCSDDPTHRRGQRAVCTEVCR